MLCSRGAGALVVAGAALAVSWLIFERAIRAGGPLEWDEAYHSLWGLLIADDLLRFRLVSFAFDSYRQVYWPPLHSWYLAALFMTFSPSIPLARASSLLALVGIAVVVYLTARLLVVGERSRTASGPGDRSCAATVGGIASAVSLLRAGGVQVLAPQAMLELPALFWLAVGFWLYVRCTLADPESGGRTYVLLGFATLATYLTRTSYGVLLALALAVAFLFDGRWLDRRPRTVAKQDDPRAAASAARRRGQTLAALAFGVPLALWLAYPAKIATTLSALSNVPVGPERFSLDGLLYYPRATLWLAGSWPLLVVWLLGLVLTLRPRLLRSDSRLRFVVIFLGLQFLLAELAVTKLERHILPLVLGFSLLGGFWAGRLWTRLEALRRTSPAWSAPALVTGLAAVGAAALLLWPAGTLGGPATMTASPPRSALLEHLAVDLRQRGPALVLAGSDLIETPAAIDWHLAAEGLLPLDGAGALVQGNDLRRLDSDRGRLPRFLPGFVQEQVDRWPGTSGAYTAYLGLPFGAPGLELAPSNFRERVAALLAHHPTDRLLVVSREGSTLSSQLAAARLAELGFAPTASPRRIDGGVSVVEFGRS